MLFGFRPSALPPPDLLTIDATGIQSFGEPPNGDVDAGWVHQTPTDRDEREVIYGYYGSALTGRNLDLSIEYPLVAFNFALTTVHDYGDNLDDVALLLLDAYKNAHGAGPPVVVDSAYPYKLDWARRVLSLGFRSTHDTHTKDREWRGEISGFQAMGEDVYCPVPHLRDLGTAVRDGVDLADYKIARDEQLRYRAQVVDVTPDHITVICPAQYLPGGKPRVRCPKHAESMRLSRAAAPTISDPPGRALACCAGPVRLDFAEHRVLAKAFQEPPYGSDAWRESWSPGRSGGEGKWGTLFGENGSHAVVGLTNWTEQARTAWAYAVALGVDNLQAVRRWWFKPHVQQRLQADVRQELAADPLLWPMDALTELYRKRFGK